MTGSAPKWSRRPAIDTSLEWLLFLPVALAIGLLILHGQDLWEWAVSLWVIRVIAVLLMVRISQRFSLLLVAVVVSCILPLMFSVSVAPMVILALLGVASFWRSVRIVATREYVYPPSLYVVGLLTYVAYAVLASRFQLYRPMLLAVTLLAFVCVALVLLEVNRITLGEASFTDTENLDVGNRVKQSNRIYVISLVTVVVILAVCGRLLGHIPKLTLHFKSHQGSIPHSQKGSGPNIPQMKHVQPGPFSHVLSILFQVFGIAVLCIVGGWFAIQAGKLIVGLVSRLVATLRGRVQRPTHRGYVDEVESLHNVSLKDRLALKRGRGGRRERSFSDLTDPRDKVRFIYRKVLARAVSQGFTVSTSSTPCETAQELTSFVEQSATKQELMPFVALYNEARYSQHEINETQTETARAHLLETRWTGKPLPKDDAD